MPSAQRPPADSSQPSEPLPQYLTLHEFAAALRVSVDTVRRWVKTGRIPAHRLPGTSGKWLIARSALDALLTQSGVR